MKLIKGDSRECRHQCRYPKLGDNIMKLNKLVGLTNVNICKYRIVFIIELI